MDNQLIAMNKLMELGVTAQSGKAVVSSRDIARVFEKRHDHVLRDIREIINKDPAWGAYHFGETPYTEPQNGQTYTEFNINRDGFTILVMGYTGEKAMRFKKAYIAAFNEMERRLAPQNYKEALLALVAAEEAREAIESQNKVLQLTAAKYEGQTDTVGLYKIGEIAEQLGISARRLNEFLKECRIQYKPNGSSTWRLYSEYLNENIALPRIVTLENGYDLPILLWTAKGRDFIFDLAEREMPRWYA